MPFISGELSVGSVCTGGFSIASASSSSCGTKARYSDMLTQPPRPTQGRVARTITDAIRLCGPETKVHPRVRRDQSLARAATSNLLTMSDNPSAPAPAPSPQPLPRDGHLNAAERAQAERTRVFLVGVGCAFLPSCALNGATKTRTQRRYLFGKDNSCEAYEECSS